MQTSRFKNTFKFQQLAWKINCNKIAFLCLSTILGFMGLWTLKPVKCKKLGYPKLDLLPLSFWKPFDAKRTWISSFLEPVRHVLLLQKCGDLNAKDTRNKKFRLMASQLDQT